MTEQPKPGIKKDRRVRDKATNKVTDTFRFRLTSGGIGTIELAPSEAYSARTFEDRLRDAGAVLPEDKAELNRLLTEAAKSVPAKGEFVYEAQPGYINSGAAYVKMDGVIGKPTEKVIGVSRINSLKDESGKLGQNGTWESWRDSVGELARDSSIMMLAICIALAGFLLYFAKRPSSIVNIFGRSRIGKSIATLMAASIRGIGRRQRMITWRNTGVRLEQRGAEHNDGIFPVDDLESMRERGKEKYLRLRETAYAFAQGWTMGRDQVYTMTHGVVHSQYRSIMLTTSEKSVRELAQEVGMERQEGEALRLLDQPALLDGLNHIFDRRKTSPTPEWMAKRFQAIVDACEANHGAAGDKFVESVIAKRSKVPGYIEKQMSSFRDQACDEFDGTVARDVALTFGFYYAAGMVGIKVGLLLWPQADLFDAIMKCYKAARDLLPDDGVLLREGIDKLKQKLRSLPLRSNVQSAGDWDQVDGYRHKDAEHDRCLIRCEAFRNLFQSQVQCDLVLDWLKTKSRITMAVSKGTNDAAAKRQHMWPGGERRRSYEILWPRPKSE
jgi:hypothetical protein